MRQSYLPLCFLMFAGMSTAAQEVIEGGNTGQDESREQVMVVLDASGSMWRRIDGRPKIEIVREAYAKMVRGWDDKGVKSGLIAYGHRRKGDCADIELLSRPGQSDGHALGKTAYKLMPKGKTPLGAAVRMAAEELKYTEQKATVILLSDGVETCGINPCQLGLDLESAGIDFTAHIVGLDIKSGDEKAQLKCLAENTGGRFIAADDTAQLDEALQTTAALQNGLQFQGLLADTGEPASQMRWEIKGSTGEFRYETDSAVLFASDFSAGALEDGAYVITGRAQAYTGSTAFSLPTKEDVIYVRLYPDIPATELTVDTPAVAGYEFEVSWIGEGAEEDRISIVPIGGDWDDAIDSVNVRTGNPVTLKAPNKTGPYELLYLNNSYENNRIDARLRFEVGDPDYALNVQGGVITAGQSFTVNWKGPGLIGDMLAIGPRTGASDDYTSMNWIEGRSPVRLSAPQTPGAYELRYYGDGYVLQFSQLVTVE